MIFRQLLRHFSAPPRNMPLMTSPFQEMHDDWRGPDKWFSSITGIFSGIERH